MGHDLGPLLDIYLDIQKQNRSEAHKNEIISELMICHLGAVLPKYLDLYVHQG